MKKIYKVICLIAFMHFSLNLNAQWQPSSTGINNGCTFCFIESSGTLFAGTRNGTYASTDNGNSWAASNTGMNTSFDPIFCLGKNSAGIFAGADSLIYFSNDNGASWTIVNNSGYYTWSFAFLGDTVFAATMGGGILMSANNGLNWTPMNNGITNNNVYSIITKGHILYAGNGDGVFVSSNSGTSWSNVSTGLPAQAFIRSLETDGTNLFAGTCYDTTSYISHGMYISSDNGASWVQLANGLSTNSEIYDIISIGDALLATDGMVYRSLDHGASWTNYSDGIDFCTSGLITDVQGFYATSSYVFCGAAIGCYISIYQQDINEVLSTNEYKNDNQTLSISPNPATGKINIQLPQQFGKIKTLEIYNCMGQLQSVQNDITTIDISGFNAGLYFLVVTNGKGEKVRGKVLKQ